MWYGLVSVNIKQQKYYLNMNPACSACLCMNEWHRRVFSFFQKKKKKKKMNPEQLKQKKTEFGFGKNVCHSNAIMC